MTKRVFIFILTMGVFVGLLMILNFVFACYIIGYWAIYTGIIAVLLTMYIILKLYKVYLKKDMAVLDSFIVGLPVYAIGTMISFIAIDYDYKGTETYSYYANGYFLHALEETGKQFIPITLVFALVFTPLFRFIKRKKKINSD